MTLEKSTTCDRSQWSIYMSHDMQTNAHHEPAETAPPYLVEVRPDVYAYVQPDGTWWINNAGFIVSATGVILIDTCATEKRTRQLLEAVRSMTDAPIRTVVNTHHHGDHTHGNYLTAPAAIVAQRKCRDLVQRMGVHVYDDVFTQPDWGSLVMSAPTITFESRLDLWADDTLVELHAIGHRAHTTNDVVAWLPEHKVLFTGDLVFNQGTPFVVMGSVPGSIAAIDRLRAFGAEVIVPGHGPACTTADLDVIERYLVMVQRTAEAAHAGGATPLEAALGVDLGEFKHLSDPERLVGNLHRAMAELNGPVANEAMSIDAAIADMLIYNGGGLLRCCA
jgi:cyclase